MGHGQIILGQEQRRRLLAMGIRFFLAAALTASGTPGGYAPFALGCVAAAGGGPLGAAALAGTGLGAVLFLRFSQALPHMAAAVLLFTAAQAFRGSRLLTKRRTVALTAAGIFLAVGSIYVIQSLSPLDNAAPCAAAAVLTGLSAWYFHPLLEQERERLEPDGLLFLGAALLLALSDVTVGELSLGRALLSLLLLYTACQRGGTAGAAAGLGIGLMTDFCTGSGGVLFGGAYGLGGLLAGQSGGRRSRAALWYLAGVFTALLPVKNQLAVPLLLEAVFGTGVFLMLPGRLFDGKRVLHAPAADSGSGRERLRAQLNRTAAALRDLYDSMGRGTPPSTEENPAVVFDRAAEKVCRGCAQCEL